MTSITVADAGLVDRREVADGHDPVAEDADVRASAGGPGAVDDDPAAEQQVEAGHEAMVTGSPPGLHRCLCYTPRSVGL